LRIPEWCTNAHLRVNSEERAVQVSDTGFATIEHLWRDGDAIELVLPMRIRAIQRPHGAMGMALGPLVFGLEVAEAWMRLPASRGFGDWEVRPRTPWNYALEVDPERPGSLGRVERRDVAGPPFGHNQAAVRIQARGYRVPDWQLVRNSAGPVPASPVTPSTEAEPVTLLPYGCARLRIAEFPYVLPAEDYDAPGGEAQAHT
jgi:hypothetical protein